MLFFIYAVIGMQVIRDFFSTKQQYNVSETCFLSCLLKHCFDSGAMYEAELSEYWKNLYLALDFLVQKIPKNTREELGVLLFSPCLCGMFTALIYIMKNLKCNESVFVKFHAS